MTNLIQGDRPVGQKESIAVLLFREGLDRVLTKTDSRVPDSLGDKLFRVALKLAYENRTDLPMRDTLIEAEHLLKLHEESKGGH